MASSVASAAETEGGLSIHPMEQFEVTPLFGDGHGGLGLLTITNSTLWMALVLAAVSALLIFGMQGRALVPNRVQSMAEILYGFVRQMVTDVLGQVEDKVFRQPMWAGNAIAEVEVLTDRVVATITTNRQKAIASAVSLKQSAMTHIEIATKGRPSRQYAQAATPKTRTKTSV